MPQLKEAAARYQVLDYPNTDDLPAEDGLPLETNWHRIQMNLLIDIVHYLWRGRDDYFVGGNMFIYYSPQEALNQDYKGPDFFLVKEVDGTRDREKWVAWEEGWRLPDVIVELMSRSTAQTDLTTKKDLYAQTFRTPDYFAYDPLNGRLYGWRLPEGADEYEPLAADEDGWLWSRELDAWVGRWRGRYLGINATWLRLYDRGGRLIPTLEEAQAQRAEAQAQRAEAEAQRAEAEAQRAEAEAQRAEAQAQRAEAEAQRAEAAEAEAERLRAELARLRGE